MDPSGRPVTGADDAGRHISQVTLTISRRLRGHCAAQHARIAEMFRFIVTPAPRRC